jgi:hypothetical protein
VLTPFQERIAAIVAGLDEAEDFALAGDGALIVRGDVDRATRDLDFFGLTIESVDRLAPAVERALTRAGMEIVTLAVESRVRASGRLAGGSAVRD